MGSGSCLGAGDAFCFFSSLFFSVEVNYMTCTDVLVPAQEQKRGRQVRERKRSADTKTTNWKGEKMSDNSFYRNAAFFIFVLHILFYVLLCVSLCCLTAKSL